MSSLLSREQQPVPPVRTVGPQVQAGLEKPSRAEDWGLLVCSELGPGGSGKAGWGGSECVLGVCE